MFRRDLQEAIEKWLNKSKIILLYGARQVGKTTLCKQILEKYSKTFKIQYFNCELFDVKKFFEISSDNALRYMIGENKLIILDEAQTVKDIGKTLKIISDTMPDVKVIATGSSSFDLANKLSEPLTGRAISFILYPFSIRELKNNTSFINATGELDHILTTGCYPEIFNASKNEAERLLNLLAGNYLYKDIFMYENIKNPHQLTELLQLLALQVGNEVSYNEIGQKLGMNRITVIKYIDILEKSFVIFKLHAFNRNKRNEISKSIKIYFYDLGIRNALIQSFAPLSLRADVGALWENFCIVEKRKLNQILDRFVNQYFYRTYEGEEVDYIEEYNGKLDGYEFKYSKENIKLPKHFIEQYKPQVFKTINKNNWFEFVI
ncbi:MAG: ATP-binding protein [Endomicrobium sp.]|jgi:predicted AAA+ superfamily ATPase|nr:ATP-binding protein [Endomicrobium sp.]